MINKRVLPLAYILITLMLVSCGQPVTNPTAEEPYVGGECDSSTTRIDMNTTTRQSVAEGDYPISCSYFCLWVPENGKNLEIGISGFMIDLDMYVDTDLSIQEFDDNGRWESINYGSGNESVRINSPGGQYYIQVCSYSGKASSFDLTSKFTP